MRINLVINNQWRQHPNYKRTLTHGFDQRTKESNFGESSTTLKTRFFFLSFTKTKPDCIRSWRLKPLFKWGCLWPFAVPIIYHHNHHHYNHHHCRGRESLIPPNQGRVHEFSRHTTFSKSLLASALCDFLVTLFYMGGFQPSTFILKPTKKSNLDYVSIFAT